MHTKDLIRWAGLAAQVAGICFVLVELLRPPVVLASVTTPRWAIVHALALALSVFGLVGVTALYARQAEAAGKLGLAGYLLLSLWLMLSLAFTFFAAFVLPGLAQAAPGLAEGFVGVFARSADAMNLGAFTALWGLADILFMVGSLVFGIATLRAGVLSRWAAGLFTIGIGLAPAYRLLPIPLQPLVALPIGLGLAWLGFALLTERRPPAADASLAHLRQAGAE
ncbi:MAG: hypothetical protein JNK29_01265 [Anaerolineales bacterium]|nr:hypothetical protein [Anaerolineales bacterium]